MYGIRQDKSVTRVWRRRITGIQLERSSFMTWRGWKRLKKQRIGLNNSGRRKAGNVLLSSSETKLTWKYRAKFLPHRLPPTQQKRSFFFKRFRPGMASAFERHSLNSLKLFPRKSRSTLKASGWSMLKATIRNRSVVDGTKKYKYAFLIYIH